MVEITIELPKDMQRLCRTCMTVLDTEINSEHYLLLENKPTDTCEMFTSLINSKVCPSDGLPKALCSQCFNQLQVFYIFKDQCLRTEQQLRDILGDSSTEVINFDIRSKLNEKEELQYFCILCNQTFETYYSLSKHSIEHESDRTLLDKYLAAQTDDIKFKDVDIPPDKLNLVKDRKKHIKNETSDSSEIKKINLAASSVFIYNCDIPDEEDNKNSDDCLNESNFTNNIEQAEDMKTTCPICNYTFDSTEEMDTHICADVIEKSLTDKMDLNQDESQQKMCNICDRTFTNDLSLSLHFLKHALLVESETDPKIFSQYIFCEICGMTFEMREELNQHVIENHQKEEATAWECSKCILVFCSELELLIHDRDTGHDKEYFWDEFINKEVTKDTFSCPMCDSVFKTRELLNKHSVQHAIKKIRCRTCKAFFCTDAAYNAHLPSHPNYVHICKICGKNLSSKASLKMHMMGIHSNHEPFVCPVCAKCFKTPNRLHHHKLIHKKHKQFVCSYCGYSTHKGGDLTVHIRTHTEERPYKCSYVNCGRGFKTSSHLSEHIRRHLQIKNYKCNICAMVFGHHNTLKTHLMQHTGEKPFQCELCNAHFRRKHHLKNHMKQHETK